MNSADTPLTLQVGVKVLIENRRGEFLLLHRSLKKYPDVKDAWDIPGGRIIPGDSLIANLRREVKEETGLTLSGMPTLLVAQDIIRSDKHIVRLTYLGYARGKIALDLEEHDECRWVAQREMRRMSDLDAYLKSVILRFQKR